MALTKTPIELSSTPSIVDGGNATAITIDSSENVLVGKTDTSIGVAGSRFISNGQVQATASGQEVLLLNRLSSDGELLNFRKDSTTVGQINSRSSDMVIGTGDTGLQFYDAGNSIFPLSASGNTNRDAAIDLGETSNRFKDLYLSGGAYLGGTGAANKLDDYEEGTWTPTLAGHYGTYGTTFTQGTRNGVYTKIGNLVTLGMEINSAGVAAANNGDIITITGLPFNIGGYGILGSHAHNAASSHVGGGWTSITATSLGHLGNNGSASGGWSWLTGNNFSTSGVAIRLTVTYRVA